MSLILEEYLSKKVSQDGGKKPTSVNMPGEIFTHFSVGKKKVNVSVSSAEQNLL